ncbi:hypothetical protein GTO91_14250 [Heliobacterium undosum]|uniref:RiboL-PSP-HEPN domain-containing protein n=1 Tax=Heliomicrobium undosum TaxID=121734 RepID=A0A845L2R2_9FIRM|nr:MAE_28990/MAE_18760 family HEPN-like nuclease [Heliomicrobium undosum]MZP30877.1 hypothetical protein [Heliomicrobium undosum]
MKIRSQTELQDFLDQSLSKRKRELTTLRFILLQCKRTHERDTLLRATLPMLYAHWEGFIKESSIAYLDYVLRQGIPLGNLTRNFIALTLRGKIVSAGLSKKNQVHKELIDLILDHAKHVASYNPNEVIDTQSNLSSNVLRDIMHTVGINFDNMWQKKVPLIDHQLLKSRNEIAHGELVPVDVTLYEQLHKFVIESLEQYKTALENAVALEAYKHSI